MGVFPLPNGGSVEKPAEYEYNGNKIGKNANHSWAAMMTDFNYDGFPDLIVANDIPNRLEAYVNVGGKKFEFIKDLNQSRYIGSWMGFGFAYI